MSVPWILPIKPRWAKLIYSGEKTLELRRWVPKRFVYAPDVAFRVLLYETRPVQAITGQCMMTADECIDCYAVTDHPLRLACLSREEFHDYTEGAEFLWGLSVTDPERFEQPQTLAEHGLKRPPQSWVRSRKEGTP